MLAASIHESACAPARPRAGTRGRSRDRHDRTLPPADAAARCVGIDAAMHPADDSSPGARRLRAVEADRGALRPTPSAAQVVDEDKRKGRQMPAIGCGDGAGAAVTQCTFIAATRAAERTAATRRRPARQHSSRHAPWCRNDLAEHALLPQPTSAVHVAAAVQTRPRAPRGGAEQRGSVSNVNARTSSALSWNTPVPQNAVPIVKPHSAWSNPALISRTWKMPMAVS